MKELIRGGMIRDMVAGIHKRLLFLRFLCFRVSVGIFFLCVCVFYPGIIQAQSPRTSLKLMVRPLKDSILLRWAPNTFEGWNAGNKYGYKLVRFTLMKNGEMVSNPASVTPELLTSSPVKPWPLPQWDKIIDLDKYVAVAAQAIYGETFTLTTTRSTSFYDVVNKVKEQDSRFSFALFAADQCPLAAKASGLWFTDKNVKPGEKYLYRLYLAAPAEVVVSDTAFAFTGTDESLALPRPLAFRAEFGDKGVILHWDMRTFDYLYNAYNIERSDDGQTYARINKQPLVYAASGEFEDNREMMFIDSLAANNKPYYYRITGHTAFGETSPPSEVASGKGVYELKAIPEIVGDDEKDGQVMLKWKYPDAEAQHIAGFRVVRSASYPSKYDSISPLLAPAVREFTDRQPMPANYYKIVVCGKNGKCEESLPSLVQPVDSIPPAPPTGLKAVADTTGKLVLTWNRNTEDDMYGYRIYRANARNEEYSQLTVEPVRDTVFVDRINVHTLTKKIYYQVMAIDKRQNHSGFSAPLEAERPDVVPPAPPALRSIASTSEGVTLRWERSTSDDVAVHLVQRKEKGQNTYAVLREIPVTDTLSVFTDTSAVAGTVYYYQVQARDRNGLVSVPSAEMAGQKMAGACTQALGDIRGKADRGKFTITLSWPQPAVIVKQYIIYRKVGDMGTMAVYTVIPGTTPVFIDTRVKADTHYSYMVQAILLSGNKMMSKEVMVEF